MVAVGSSLRLQAAPSEGPFLPAVHPTNVQTGPSATSHSLRTTVSNYCVALHCIGGWCIGGWAWHVSSDACGRHKANACTCPNNWALCCSLPPPHPPSLQATARPPAAPAPAASPRCKPTAGQPTPPPPPPPRLLLAAGGSSPAAAACCGRGEIEGRCHAVHVAPMLSLHLTRVVCTAAAAPWTPSTSLLVFHSFLHHTPPAKPF